MQLTDAEIREILRRRKIEKKRRQNRRRRITLFIILLIIILIFVAVKYGDKFSFGTKGRTSGATGSVRGIVFIDPGHGGVDSGSLKGDRYEKDDTLKLSLALRDALQARDFQVEMSRTEDVDVDRTARGVMANERGAQLFVSVHRNKAEGDGKGVEAFIPKTDDPKSRMLAENILHALAGQGFVERTVRAGTLYSPAEDYEENASTTMPSALVEIGFISSDIDNALFDDNLEGNAKAVANAIDRTFMSLYEPEKAAEFAELESTAKAAAEQAEKATGQAVSGAYDSLEPVELPEEKTESEDPGGIDPEADPEEAQ